MSDSKAMLLLQPEDESCITISQNPQNLSDRFSA